MTTTTNRIRISCDDACASDARLAELAEKYGIELIFYWPIEWRSLAYIKGYQPLSYVDARLLARDFEVGAHTITHPHLTKIPFSEAVTEIIESKLMLQDLFNINVEKFCPPRGYTNGELTKITLDVYDSQRLTRGRGLVHIHPDSGANSNRPWKECIDEDTKELWCHSWELDKFDLWHELEGFLRSTL